MSELYRAIGVCRSCGSSELETILDLGTTPLADRLLTADELDLEEPTAPLILLLCTGCSLVQIKHTVKPEILFGADYPYYSSASPAWLEHCQQNALEIIEGRGLGGDNLVVELASNDGYLLKNFVDAGIPVLGIDPAPGPAARARERGIRTLVEFFGRQSGEQLAATGERADVVLANNVLAHVEDVNDFVAGMAAILNEDGQIVIEVPYLLDLIEKCEFDTIYHQHLCYFSLTALQSHFERHGLYLNLVRRLSTHGGSLRLYITRSQAEDASVRELVRWESEMGVDDPEFYGDFAGRVEGIKQALLDLLQGLKKEGRSIVGYGAAAKSCTLASYVGIDRSLINYVVDINEFKHGKFTPGNQLPILPTETLLEKQPDTVLLFAWNFAEEILAMQREYRDRGGQFILPIPEPRIIYQ